MSVRKRHQELLQLLEQAYDRSARPAFAQYDPIQVPKHFTRREDAETIGFITATIAWGQRQTIISNAWKLVRAMDGAPYDFVMHASPGETARLATFVHRTFNGVDLQHFIHAIRHLNQEYGGIENAFLEAGQAGEMGTAISRFRERFFEVAHQQRTRKHVADPAKGSNAKRINMYLRWMVRPTDRGVDLGLWQQIKPAELMVPLDVHTGRVSRELGILKRKQDDWKAVEELTAQLRAFDPVDPVRFDIALFSMGVEAGRGPARKEEVPSN